MRKVSVVVVALCLAGATAYAQQGRPAGPGGKGQGGAGADRFPNGCVDCHTGENAIPAIMTKLAQQVPPELLQKSQKAAPQGLTLKGKHPDVAARTKNVPKDCLTCHRAESKTAPPMARLSHLLHLGEGGAFMREHQGMCQHCHRMDPDTGAIVTKGGPVR